MRLQGLALQILVRIEERVCPVQAVTTIAVATSAIQALTASMDKVLINHMMEWIVSVCTLLVSSQNIFVKMFLFKGCSHGAIATMIYISQLMSFMAFSVVVTIALALKPI